MNRYVASLTSSLGLLVLIYITLLTILVFEVLMFISVINDKHLVMNRKVWWLVGMVLLHPLVAIVYYFTDYKKT